MLASTFCPTRSALRYFGGKWNLGPWIIKHFPPHVNYIEPCGGAACVLLQKPRSTIETYNDLDGNVVNFFRVLRDMPDVLIRSIQITPYAREEYNLSKIPCDEPIERARRFYWGCHMSIVGMAFSKSGFRVLKSVDTQLSGTPVAMIHLDDYYLVAIATRLKGIQIESKPCEEIIEMYDAKNNLFYFDPPYPHDTRISKNNYAYEWTDKQHTIAAELLRKCLGYVVVSGYACKLYSELYEAHGWERRDIESRVQGKAKKTESIWLSPRTSEALNIPCQTTFL